MATGSGNTAIAAARRFCEATGIDYVPAPIEQAKKCAEGERLEVAFEVGDAEDLPFAEASSDVVLSTVGVMFAPDQERSVSELLRVCGPGEDRACKLDGRGIRRQHVPHRRRALPPARRGEVACALEHRRASAGALRPRDLLAAHDAAQLRLPVSLAGGHFIEFFRAYYGPMNKAFESLDAVGQDALARELEELLHNWDTSGDETAVVPPDYLEAVAVRR
jgi:SAM-dependent methyltransferase